MTRSTFSRWRPATVAEDIQRLSRFCMPEPNSGCWLWIGSIGRRGYGNFQFRGACWKAHRASFVLYNGELSDGQLVCHRCDNPSCVNPQHLFAGSSVDNMQDCKSKGRNARGERCARSKLTEQQVLEVRASSLTNGELAAKFSVSKNAIHLARSGGTWSWL